MKTFAAVLVLVPAFVLGGLSACTPADDDSNNCGTCAADSEEQQACIDALRGCEETEEEDTPEEHEACEADANANCE